MKPRVQASIQTLPSDTWIGIEYPWKVPNPAAGELVDTAEIDNTVIGSTPKSQQVFADLKDSALARLPAGQFTANAAWLAFTAITFDLARPPKRLCWRPLAPPPPPCAPA